MNTSFEQVKGNGSLSDPLELLDYMDFETWAEYGEVLELRQIQNCRPNRPIPSIIIDSAYERELAELERDLVWETIDDVRPNTRLNSSRKSGLLMTTIISVLVVGLFAAAAALWKGNTEMSTAKDVDQSVSMVKRPAPLPKKVKFPTSS